MFTKRFCSQVWRESQLAHRKLTLERYLAHGHVVMEPHNAKTYETKSLAERRIHRRVDVTTFSFPKVPRLIVGTSRIVTLHRRLASQADY